VRTQENQKSLLPAPPGYSWELLGFVLGNVAPEIQPYYLIRRCKSWGPVGFHPGGLCP
jgi:hypothetical protein